MHFKSMSDYQYLTFDSNRGVLIIMNVLKGPCQAALIKRPRRTTGIFRDGNQYLGENQV